MFPFVDGFHWTFGHILFLSSFGAVLFGLGVAVTLAFARVIGDHRRRGIDAIRWHCEFHDLPSYDRRCRHELAGRVEHRECENAFDCGHCSENQRIAAIEPAAAPPPETYGLDFPADRLYHRGHTWVRQESDGTYTIGLTDLGRRLIGTPDVVELPPVGTRLEAHGTAFKAHKNNTKVRVLAPLEGEIVQLGGPEHDWYLRVQPLRTPANTAHLLRGTEVSFWLRAELERLQILLSPASTGPSLADGGVLLDDLPNAQPDANWDAVLGEMFLEP